MDSNEPELIGEVTLEKGFLPLFAQSFIEHYGLFSLFVRAVSDYFTNGLVKMFLANDKPLPENIVNYAPAEATEALSVLMKSFILVHGRRVAGQALLNEWAGLEPIGSFSDFVDSTIGEGCFQNWLSALEAEHYVEACSVVQIGASDE